MAATAPGTGASAGPGTARPPYNRFRSPGSVPTDGRVRNAGLGTRLERRAGSADARCPVDEGRGLPLIDEIEDRLVGRILKMQCAVLCDDLEWAKGRWAGR